MKLRRYRVHSGVGSEPKYPLRFPVLGLRPYVFCFLHNLPSHWVAKQTLSAADRLAVPHHVVNGK
jgi:hypothetical protein